jgi:Cdc6-like AAA superfamily ATPase
VSGLSADASDQARQANFAGDNYAPITFAGAQAPAPSLHQLPAAIPDFSGRADDIAKIERLAATSGSVPSVVNICGPPGIGKSALTLYVAHRIAKNLKEVQLYAQLSDQRGHVPTSQEILQEFVAALDPATIGTPVGAQDLPGRYRSLLNGRRCLVILDDAQSVGQINDLVPGRSVSTVLVTSRAPMASIAGIRLYHLALMSSNESLELLSAVSGRMWPDGEPPNAAGLLIGYCGRLPLALRIIGAILKKKPHWTLEKVAEDLASEVTRLAKLVEGPLNVRSCFEVSYRHLSEKEAQVFRLLSLLPLSVFKLGHASSFLQQPKDQTESLIEALIDAQLLETEDGANFRFHDLLRLYGREQSNAAEDDPGGARTARFIKELTGEFLDSYIRRLRENAWIITRPRYSENLRPGKFMVAPPDSLYIQTRLTAACNPEGYTYSWRELLAQYQRVLVVGAGGTGKTVFADRICYEIAASHDRVEGSYEVAFTVPLRLRSGDDQSLERLIAGAARSRYRLDVSEDTISALLQIRRAVVIFDGLDEVPFTRRSPLVQAVKSFCDAYPQVTVIVTSRPELGDVTFAALNFQQFQIPPLSETDIAEYIRRWGQVRHAGLVQASVRDRITPTEVRREWLSTPLLLTQLIEIYERIGFVPIQEIELYDAMYSAFFGSREIARGISRVSTLRAKDFGRLFSYLAYELKARGRVARGAADAEVYLLIKSIFREWHHPWSEMDIRNIASDLAALDLPVRRTIDAANGRPSWWVTRDPFSEYLAARWMVTESSSFNQLATRLLIMIETGEFIAGGRFVFQLVPMQDLYKVNDIKDYLQNLLSRRIILSDRARASVMEILSHLK